MSTASPQSPQSEQKLLFCLLTPQLRNAGGGQLKPTHGCEAPPLLLKAPCHLPGVRALTLPYAMHT